MFIVLPNNLVQFIVMIFPSPLVLDSWFCFYFLLAYKYLVILHLQHSYVYLIINGYIFTLSVHLGHLKLYKFEEMRMVTNNFSQNNILGEGGYGIVYKGCLPDGTIVAVKRLKNHALDTGVINSSQKLK